jgi:hypothetical protein
MLSFDLRDQIEEAQKNPVLLFSITVKPVYNGHLWDPKIEAVVDRW